MTRGMFLKIGHISRKSIIVLLMAGFPFSINCGHPRIQNSHDEHRCEQKLVPILRVEDNDHAIGLNSTIEEVLTLLGPAEDLSEGSWSCDRSRTEHVTGTAQSLLYDGVYFTTIRPDDAVEFKVRRIIISEARYPLVSGLRVGSSRKEVVATYGTPGANDKIDAGSIEEQLRYVLNECGDVMTFYLRDETVWKITAESWC